MQATRNKGIQVLLYAILAFWTFFALFPIYWTIITSVKPQKAVNAPKPTFFPWIDFQPTLQPFQATA